MISLPDIILPKRDFFGLSIDQSAIRGIQIDRKGNTFCMSEIFFSEEIFSHGILVKGALFQDALKNLQIKGKFTTPYVVVTFPEAFSYTRELHLPNIPLEELSEAVEWHSKELFPFPEEEIYFDWKILRKTEDNYILAVVAVPKNTIDPIVHILLSAGLKPLNLRPDASTITYLLRFPSDCHAIVAEINKTVAYVTLVEGEKSMFTTIINLAKDDTPDSYLYSIKQTIEEITSYYRNKGIIHNELVDIVLTGELAEEEWVKKILSSAKVLKTPPKNPAFNKAYAVAIMEFDAVPHHDTINLLPASMQKMYEEERKVEYYKVILFRGISIAGSYCVFILFILFIILVQKQDLDRDVKKLITIRESSKKSSQNLLKVNATAKQIIALAPFRKTPHEKLRKFFSLIPEGIVVTNMNYDDSKLVFTLSGIAKTRENLLNLRSNLEKSNEFTKISFPLSLLEVSKDINFSIQFSIK